MRDFAELEKLGTKLRSVGPRGSDYPFNPWHFMPAKPEEDQMFALGAAQSPCRGCGPAMRGGLRP